MKIFLSLIVLAAFTVTPLQADILVSTETSNVSTLTLDGSTAASSTSTHAGVWGTFDLVVDVLGTAPLVVTGGGILDNDNNDITFTVSTANVALNPDYYLNDLSLFTIKYNAAGGATDSGTLVGPWGSVTWTDAGVPQTPLIAGHDDTSSRFNLFGAGTLNGNSPLTSFTSEFENNAFRINDVRASVDVFQVAVPEPGSAALISVLGTVLGLRRRRS